MKSFAKNFFILSLTGVFFLQGLSPVYSQQLAFPNGDDSLVNRQQKDQSEVTSFRNLFDSKGPNSRTNSKKNLLDRDSLSSPSTLVLTYQIHILGEVASPGTYRIGVSARFSEAIDGAGGILERGSDRLVELRRNGMPTQVIDIFSFKQHGNLNDNPYLLDNDVIFVPLKKKTVQILGPVNRPNIYEVKNEKTIEDLVRLAGGFSSGISEKETIKIVRFEDGKKVVLEVPNTTADRQSFLIKNADVIIIPHIFLKKNKFDYNVVRLPGDNIFYPSYESRVFVLGAVYQSGPQPFNQYANIRQYLTLAGGTTKLAKTHRIRVLTSNGKSVKAKDNTQINPGDTIIVPERYLAPESWVNITLSFASTILGITTTVIALTKL